MSGPSVLRQLARPDTEAERRRERLVAAAVAGCGMFLLAALAVLTAPDGVHRQYFDNGGVRTIDIPRSERLAPFLADPELRPGAALGAVLLVVPFSLLGWQALRTGTAARERRLAALSLAGATRTQLRRLAHLEGMRAAVIGGLLAGPAYVGLWLLFGVLLPNGAKMLPRPTSPVIAGWPVLVILLALAGAQAAGMAARPATVNPLGAPRVRPRGPGFAAVVPIVLASVVLIVGLVLLGRQTILELLVAPAMAGALILVAMSAGPWLIRIVARQALHGDLLTVLAARRLLTDVRSPGRVAGVLFVVGAVIGGIGAMAVAIGFSGTFYLGGLAAAGIGALLAVVVATGSLIVGVTEQVLQGRRSTSALVALAVSPDFVCDLVKRQILLAAVPATVIGSVVGWLVMITGSDGFSPLSVLSLPIVAGMAGLAAKTGVRVTARTVRPAVLESSRLDNLRVP